MKKSVLIAPVLGIMLVAAAGSVGGTVAWFSASSSWETTVSQFSVTRLDGNLRCTMAGTVGTTAAEGNQSVSVDNTPALKLTHASYNIADGDVASALLYTIDGSGEEHDYASKGAHGAADTAYTSSASRGTPGAAWYVRNVTVPSTFDVFYAVAWTMTFAYDFGADTAPINLYFDPTSDLVSVVPGAGEYSKHTNLGFRVAFMNATAANSFVWAPKQNKEFCKHVTGVDRKEYIDELDNTAALEAVENPVKGDVYKVTSPAGVKMWDGDSWEDTTDDGYTVTPYTATNLVAKDTTKGTASGNAIQSGDTSGFTDATTRIHPNYMGQFTPSSGAFSASNNIVITCVAWFEGTDPNVVNDSTLDTFAANLKFFTHVAG